MAQKPLLRGEVGACALRIRSKVRGDVQERLRNALGCGRGCLKPIKACGVVESAFVLMAPPRGDLSVAPRDSDRCWKEFMMCLEGIRFVAMMHLRFFNSSPMHTRSYFKGHRHRAQPHCANGFLEAPERRRVPSVLSVWN